MNNKLIIKDVFGSVTGLRHCDISEKSGEEFYHDFLNSAFKNSVDQKLKLEIILDGIRGYSPSFIDETFGNLVYDFTKKLVEEYLIIISNSKKYWLTSIQEQTIPDWEDRRVENKAPKKTRPHKDWWYYDKGEFKLRSN